MIQKLKTIIMTAIVPLMTIAPVALVPAVASAACNNDIASSLNAGVNAATGSNDNCSDSSGTGPNLQQLATKIVNLLSVVVGIIAVIMIIVGGFRYITSGGESSNVSGAKNTLIYAIVGLVIVALAQFIVHFVLANVAGAQS